MLKVNLLNYQNKTANNMLSGTILPPVTFRELQELRGFASGFSIHPASPVVGISGHEGCGKTMFLQQAGRLLSDMGFRTVAVSPMQNLLVEDPRICLGELWRLLHHKIPGFPANQSNIEVLREYVSSTWEVLPPALRRESLSGLLSEGIIRVSENDPIAVLVDDFFLFREVTRNILYRAFHAVAEREAHVLFVVVSSPDTIDRWRNEKLLAGQIGLHGFSKRQFKEFLSSWSKYKIGGSFFKKLWNVTGGFPRYSFHLLSLLSEESKSRIFSKELEILAGETPSDIVARRLKLLSGNQRDILTILYFCARPVMQNFLKSFIDLPAASFKGELKFLDAGGWISRDGPWLNLKERFLGQVLLESFPECERLDELIRNKLKKDGRLSTEISSHGLSAGEEDKELTESAIKDLLFWGDSEGNCQLALNYVIDSSMVFRIVQDLISDGKKEDAWKIIKKYKDCSIEKVDLLKAGIKELEGDSVEAIRFYSKFLKSEEIDQAGKDAALCGLLRLEGDESERALLLKDFFDRCKKGNVKPKGLVSFAEYLIRSGMFDEARKVLESSSRQGNGYINWLSRVLDGKLCSRLGFIDECNRLYEEADEIASSSGFNVLKGRSLLLESEGLLTVGRHEEARDLLKEARNYLAGPGLGAQADLYRAVISTFRFDLRGILHFAGRAVADAGSFSGDLWPWGDSFVFESLSHIDENILKADRFLSEGYMSAAEKLFMKSLKRYKQAGEKEKSAVILQKLAMLSCLQGNDSVSLSCIAESLRCVRGTVSPKLAAGANLVSARVSILIGNYKRAYSSLGAAFKGFVVDSDLKGIAQVFGSFSYLFRVLGIYDLSAGFAVICSKFAELTSDEKLLAKARLEGVWADLHSGRRNMAKAKLSEVNEAGDIWCKLEKKLILSCFERGGKGAEIAQQVADKAREIGAQDLLAEAALMVGSVQAKEVNLIQGVEIIQSVLDLALRRRRPELVLRAEAVLGELFLKRGRNKPAREFLRRAGERINSILKCIPVDFQSNFIAKSQYKAVVTFINNQEGKGIENKIVVVENLGKTISNNKNIVNERY